MRKSNTDILEYVYADLEIKENDQKNLMDEQRINGIRKLRNISEDDFKVVKGTDEHNSRIILARQLKHMVTWMRYYKSENDNPPNTTEEFESDFNEDIFNGFQDDRITTINEVKEEERVSRNKKDKNTNIMQIRMPDYLDFYGAASARSGV